jgi:hypothetical protein
MSDLLAPVVHGLSMLPLRHIQRQPFTARSGLL